MTINDKLAEVEAKTEAVTARRPFTDADKRQAIELFNEHENLILQGYKEGFNAACRTREQRIMDHARAYYSA
jgi:hypothetical protein